MAKLRIIIQYEYQDYVKAMQMKERLNVATNFECDITTEEDKNG
jgi:hypothetical protein